MKQKKGMELVTERTVDGFRRELLRREYSHGTAESYVRSIRAFARWSGGAVDRGLVLTWKARLTAQYAPATVNAMLAGLNRFFDFSGRPECRVKVLRLQRCSFREAERELDRGEYRALIRTARTLGRERLALVMETICATGIRVGEVPFITVEAACRGRTDVALKGKVRTIFIPDRLCRRLLQYARKQKITSGEIFLTGGGKRLSRTQIWAEIEAAVPRRRCGGGKGLSPQSAAPVRPDLLPGLSGRSEAGGYFGSQLHRDHSDLPADHRHGASAAAGTAGTALLDKMMILSHIGGKKAAGPRRQLKVYLKN